MIVGYLDIVGIATGPGKTNSPLVVDSNAVLSLSIAFQGFESISRRNPKEFKFHRGMNLEKFPTGNALDVGGNPPAFSRFKQTTRFPVSKGSDHSQEC